jgi:preprotein translocase subunit SecE
MPNKIKVRKLLLVIVLLFLFVLLIGTIGFHYLSDLDWLDSLHNSSMYLAGLGPLYEMKTTKEKIFSTFYAIIASILFLALIIFLMDRIIQMELF